MAEPSETEREAAAAARHIYDTEPGTGAWRDDGLRVLEDACGAALRSRFTITAAGL